MRMTLLKILCCFLVLGLIGCVVVKVDKDEWNKLSTNKSLAGKWVIRKGKEVLIFNMKEKPETVTLNSVNYFDHSRSPTSSKSYIKTIEGTSGNFLLTQPAFNKQRPNQKDKYFIIQYALSDNVLSLLLPDLKSISEENQYFIGEGESRSLRGVDKGALALLNEFSLSDNQIVFIKDD